MWIRRTIAAFVTLAFATLLAAPAFAGFWDATSTGGDRCCCCSKKDEQKQAHLDAPACECGACACTLEKGKDRLPLDSLSVGSWAPLVATGTTTPSHYTVPALRSGPVQTIGAPRGPPRSAAEPLYILYDTLLI